MLSIVVVATVTKSAGLAMLCAAAILAAVFVGDQWDARGGGM